MSDLLVSYIGSFIRVGDVSYLGDWCPTGRQSWRPYSDQKAVMQFKKVGSSSDKEMDRQRQLEFWNLVSRADDKFPPDDDEITTTESIPTTTTGSAVTHGISLLFVFISFFTIV